MQQYNNAVPIWNIKFCFKRNVLIFIIELKIKEFTYYYISFAQCILNPVCAQYVILYLKILLNNITIVPNFYINIIYILIDSFIFS